MNDSLYVSTDVEGVEHSATSGIQWNLPPDRAPTVAGSGRLVLRRPVALLEVFEDEIFRAEPTAAVAPDLDGIVTTDSARLIARTAWNSETATLFALDCAEHALEGAPDAALPDGTALETVIAEARQMVQDAALESSHRFGYLARLGAFRRLRRGQAAVADLALAHMVEDERRDLEALDDLAYAAIVPVADAMLAAVEALRHHVLPHLYTALSDAAEENEEAKSLDPEEPGHAPLPAQTTPFGPIMFGGGPSVLRYATFGASAREAARHARMAAFDREGEAGERDERTWQAERLAALLERS